MKKQRLPKGWSEKQVRELAAHHDNQSAAQQAAEIDAALRSKDNTLMIVPTKLVPQIRKLIARKLTA